jgi:UDP-2,3-diacylglucosamine pyrophosphatase LpxH
VCQAELLEEFLFWAVDHTAELVINGDIFDDLNFKRLKRHHFACLKVIRKNSDRTDLKLVWIRGNHDGPADIVSHLVGVEIFDEYLYQNEDVRLLILHGDQFDQIVTRYPLMTALASWLFYGFQRLAPHRAARWVRRISKQWQRNSQLIERGAIQYAREKGCQFVTCGHTHGAMASEHDGTRYFNTGTWTERPPCPYLAVVGAEVRLEYWPAEHSAPKSVDQGESMVSPAAQK